MRVTTVTMETYLLILCACADNHVALLFINKMGGSRRGLSIQLSGIFTYPACFWNQGVRIIEVLLYCYYSCMHAGGLMYIDSLHTYLSTAFTFYDNPWQCNGYCVFYFVIVLCRQQPYFSMLFCVPK